MREYLRTIGARMIHLIPTLKREQREAFIQRAKGYREEIAKEISTLPEDCFIQLINKTLLTGEDQLTPNQYAEITRDPSSQLSEEREQYLHYKEQHPFSSEDSGGFIRVTSRRKKY